MKRFMVGGFKAWAMLFLAAALCLAGVRLSQAASGDLDPTFGNGGTVVTDFNGFGDKLTDIALQADGKIIAVGFVDINTGGSEKVELARYNADGTLDATFGSGGKVITDLPSVVYSTARSVVIQPDGKIIIAGSATLPTVVDTSFLLIRYNTDGSLDMSFGSGGIVLTNVGDYRDSAESVVLRADGKIVAAGEKGIFRPPGEERNSDVAVVRYNSDGSLDTAFGTAGRMISDFGPPTGNFADDASSINLQPDGKLIIGGDSDGSGYYDFLIARYNANGSLDDSFGNGGFTKTDLGNGNADGSCDIALQKDGKFVSVGAASSNSFDLDFAMIRYNSNGSIDSTFGTGGHVVFNLQNLADEELTSVVIQKDGKIVALGDSNSAVNSGFLLFRFNKNGSLDTTFGVGGIVRTPFGGDAVQTAAIALQPDSKIVAAGFSPLYQTSNFVLARYLNPQKVRILTQSAQTD